MTAYFTEITFALNSVLAKNSYNIPAQKAIFMKGKCKLIGKNF